MHNTSSIRKVDHSRWGQLVKPQYKDYCFANIRPSLEALLLGETPTLPAEAFPPISNPIKHAVFLLVDALGWELLQKVTRSSPTVAGLIQKGHLSKATSVFPSSTTPSMFQLHFKQSPLDTGVLDWTTYHHQSGEVLCPILNSTLDHAYGDSMKADTLPKGDDIFTLFAENHTYTQTRAQGISSHNLLPQHISNSSFSRLILNGSETSGYRELSEGFATLGQVLSSDSPTYSHLYYPEVDSASHRYGPLHPTTTALVEGFFTELSKFINRIAGRQDTLLIVSADHGQIPVETDLWIEDEVPEALSLLEVDKNGRPLQCVGSSRSLFLYARKGCDQKLNELLQQSLSSHVEIVGWQDMIDNGLLGVNREENSFHEKAPSICLLPKEGVQIFFRGENDHFVEPLAGVHGGLSPWEAHIPILSFLL